MAKKLKEVTPEAEALKEELREAVKAFNATRKVWMPLTEGSPEEAKAWDAFDSAKGKLAVVRDRLAKLGF